MVSHNSTVKPIFNHVQRRHFPGEQMEMINPGCFPVASSILLFLANLLVLTALQRGNNGTRDGIPTNDQVPEVHSTRTQARRREKDSCATAGGQTTGRESPLSTRTN